MPPVGSRYGSANDIWFHRDEYGNEIYQNFYELTNGLNLVQNDIIAFHSVETYMAFLMTKDDKGIGVPDEKKKKVLTKLLRFKCPVDVEIYVEDDAGCQVLAGQIKNNKADSNLNCGIYTYVDGDVKYACLLDDGEYTAKI